MKKAIKTVLALAVILCTFTFFSCTGTTEQSGGGSGRGDVEDAFVLGDNFE